MIGKISKIANLVSNMGWRYFSFRARHEVLKKTGLLKSRFPVAPSFKQYLTLQQWRSQPVQFFFKDRESLTITRHTNPELKEKYEQIKSGKLLLFSSLLTDLGKDYDWITNPDSGFHYNVNKHWTQIADYSKEAGDIKFVWEKSRFSYLYDIIRYDYHYNQDCAEFVFNDIRSWIKNNPINCGPNYRCSQEMSLRVLNWTFALYYYRNSPLLTEEVFSELQHTIYWHISHVYNNIDFSRIAVRNNHAITETLALYLAGLFYPSMPGADQWKKKGKAWFEQEIAYQVYEDGTFLQFSTNYHRIVVQLLTWGITLSEKNGERFSDVVYDRARKSLQFLSTCMVKENGWLPNYGANDGALFFKLSDSHYRDYRPQLEALAKTLGISLGYDQSFEDVDWYGLTNPTTETMIPKDGPHSFPNGGYYIIREDDSLTFIKCGSHKDRPSQADNLHIDIWYKGENILPDAGSYKYNTDDKTIRYFSGTQSHNTVMLDDKDQMLKGGRFIWYYWSQCRDAALAESNSVFTFTGSINAFTYIKNDIVHKRSIIKHKGKAVWEIKDEIINAPGEMTMRQLWHTPISPKYKATIIAKEKDGTMLQPQIADGWHSSLYGQKEKVTELCFVSKNKVVETIITLK